MSKTKSRCILCQEKDCFAYYKGVCSILTDTKFKRKCPFYKPKMSVNVSK